MERAQILLIIRVILVVAQLIGPELIVKHQLHVQVILVKTVVNVLIQLILLLIHAGVVSLIILDRTAKYQFLV